MAGTAPRSGPAGGASPLLCVLCAVFNGPFPLASFWTLHNVHGEFRALPTKEGSSELSAKDSPTSHASPARPAPIPRVPRRSHHPLGTQVWRADTCGPGPC